MNLSLMEMGMRKKALDFLINERGLNEQIIKKV